MAELAFACLDAGRPFLEQSPRLLAGLQRLMHGLSRTLLVTEAKKLDRKAAIKWKKALKQDMPLTEEQQAAWKRLKARHPDEFSKKEVDYPFQPPNLLEALTLSSWALRMAGPGRPMGAPGPASQCFDAVYTVRNGFHPLATEYKKLITSPFSDGDAHINNAKVFFDLEQIEYVLSQSTGRGAPSDALRPHLERWASSKESLRLLAKQLKPGSFENVATLFRKAAMNQKTKAAGAIAPLFNRALHVRAPPLPDSSLLTEDPIPPSLDVRAIEKGYSTDGVAVIDDILSPVVIEELRAYCLESTIWHDLKTTYMGAYWHRGFTSPVLLRVARALQDRFAFIRKWPLTMAWAYAYSNTDIEGRNRTRSNIGIPIHADDARVNVNIWITPDEAKIGTGGGGLIIYPKTPPLSWTKSQLLQPVQKGNAVHQFIAGVSPRSVDYKYNRAAIFDSDFFHQTAPLKFKPGHASRRINLTLLFGEMDHRRERGDGSV